MVWYLFAILGAFFDATYYALIKRQLREIDPHALAGGVFLSSSAILLSLSLLRGLPETGPLFYRSVLATVALNAAAASLYFKALRITALSLSIPMISFTPLFLIFTSSFILRESPSASGAMGILFIVLGSYVLNSTVDRSDLLGPFHNILRERGVLYMLGVAFLFSISSNYDKLVVVNSDPVFGSSIVYLHLGVLFLIISLKRHNCQRTGRINLRELFLTGLVLSLMSIAINTALTLQIVPYVISLKRMNILFSVLYGGLMFGEENIVRRGVGAMIMVVGAVLIVLF